MRIGVLDIGSNTGHLLVVDAHGGAAPLSAYSYKQPLRLAEHLDADGTMATSGTESLIRFVSEALPIAEEKGCQEILGFATSAIRDAGNSDDVLGQVSERCGTRITVLSGEDEARLTFLAVRRWFGWSAGRVAMFDIGGGSLEIASGGDESPDAAWSLPLGAARLARAWLKTDSGPAGPDQLQEVRRYIRTEIARDAGYVLRGGAPDRAVATSKTFRSLSRICGAAPAGAGPLVPRSLAREDLRRWIPELASMTHEEITSLPGVSARRAHQVLAGALVAEACLDIFDLSVLDICPWALREGVILERLDQISVLQR